MFPTLTVLAAKYIFVHFSNTSLPAELAPACAPGLPFARAYVRVPVVDELLCRLVAFFDASFQPEAETFTTHLVVSLFPIALFTFVEAARSGRPLGLSSPVVAAMGIVYQRFTGGVILPLYWAAFILTGSAQRRGTVDLRFARSLSFASIVGYALPSVLMVGTLSPGWIALWQAFPLLLLLTERVFLILQPKPLGNFSISGTRSIRTLYTTTAAFIAIVHLAVVLPNLGNPATLKQIFVPHVVGTEFEKLTAAAGTLNMLQWDNVFIVIAAQLASLWFGRSASEVVGLVVWNVVGGLALGPGAALALVYAWREGFVGA